MKSHQELGPVELLLLAGLALLWALWTVARLVPVPLLALLLSWCCCASTAGTLPAVTAAIEAPQPAEAEPLPRPAPVTDALPVPAVTATAAPTLAQLASEVAATLQPLTVKQLWAQARAAGLPRSLSRTGRRDALLSALSGLEVALI